MSSELHKVDDPTKVFGTRLREARQRKDISQKKLGILAGIDESSASPRVNQYEQGTHTPNYSIACRLADVLEIPVQYFYTSDPAWLKLIIKLNGLQKKEFDRAMQLIDKEFD